MAEEYKNFNNYEEAPEKTEEPAVEATEPTVEAAEPTVEAAEPTVEAAPDPNPPTGWAPGYEQASPAVSTRSPKGIVSIILSFAGYCTYGIASIVGIFLGASALRRNKHDVTAKIGLTACILMTIFWAAYIAFLVFTPAGRELLAEIFSESQQMMEEMYSSNDIYNLTFFR